MPPIVKQVNSHTVFEVEQVAQGLEFVANGNLDRRIKILSKKKLIGPKVSLQCALEFDLIGATLYFSSRTPWRIKVRLVDATVIYENRVNQVTFEAEEILEYSERMYELAACLAGLIWPRFV